MDGKLLDGLSKRGTHVKSAIEDDVAVRTGSGKSLARGKPACP
jgi:hypothetical protein